MSLRITPPTPERMSEETNDLINQIIKEPSRRWSLRCSRPLCSSQNTVGTPHPPAHSRQDKGPRGSGTTQRPARSLRTQQRARPHHPNPKRSLPSQAVLASNPSDEDLCQCSTHELHSGTFDRTWLRLNRPKPTQHRCSLERR